MYVTKLELWSDTEFVENSAEYPSLSDTLTNPDHTYTDLHPAKEDLFSYFKIKGVSYETLISVSYARVTYNNLSYPVYMWVDRVACISDTSTKLTAISCHVDLWRTYLGDARLGYGLITKRIRGTADPIQSCPYRYRLSGEYQELKTTAAGNECYWVLINTTAHNVKGKDADTKISRPRTMVIPVDKDGVGSVYVTATTAAEKKICPTLKNFVSGDYDEILGISPEIISSVFIYPFPPVFIKSGDGSSETPYIITPTTETSEVWTTDTGRVDFTRLIGVSMADNSTRINCYYSNGSTTSYYEAADARSTVTKFVEGAVAVEAGYPPSSTELVLMIRSTTTGQLEEYRVHMPLTFPLVKLDTMMADKSPVENAKVTLSGCKAVWSGGSIELTKDMTSYTVTFSGTESAATTFTYKDGTWGDYWISYDPNNLPTYTLEIPDIKEQISQGLDSYDNEHYYIFTDTGRYKELQLSVDVQTTDTSEAVLLDFDGNPVFSLPWGRHFTACTVRPIVTMSSAVMEVRFDSQDSRADGTCAVITLPSVDITSNAWSEYVYSGQREYDISQRQIAAKQALVSGITGGAQNAVSTGVMGSLGNLKDKDRTEVIPGTNVSDLLTGEPLGPRTKVVAGSQWSVAKMAGVTGGAMLGVSLAGAAVDYAAAQYFNGKLQDTEDTLRSKQSESLILAGSGWDWLYYGRMPGFVTLVPDDYSLVNFQNNILYNGISCSEPTADCSAYKDYLGPIQIQNLIVTGTIPVQAKYFIANTYAKGIRMKCLNARPPYDATISTFTETSVLAGTYVLYNDTDYKYKINCVANDEIREQYIVEAGDNVTVTLVAGDVISTLYYDKMWVANQNTVNVL